MNKKKIIIIVVAVVLVIGASIGTVFGVKAYNDKKAEEQLIAQREALVKSYNDDFGQIIILLNTVDAEGQNPSLDNNNDIDAMNNAINSLNDLKNKINSDTTITDEQKTTLNKAIDDNINKINARIQAVNEANARAEAERLAKEEEERQAQAQAEKRKQSQQTTSKSSSASSGKSSSDNTSNSGSGDYVIYYDGYSNVNGRLGKADGTPVTSEDVRESERRTRERDALYRWDPTTGQFVPR